MEVVLYEILNLYFGLAVKASSEGFIGKASSFDSDKLAFEGRTKENFAVDRMIGKKETFASVQGFRFTGG